MVCQASPLTKPGEVVSAVTQSWIPRPLDHSEKQLMILSNLLVIIKPVFHMASCSCNGLWDIDGECGFLMHKIMCRIDRLVFSVLVHIPFSCFRSMHSAVTLKKVKGIVYPKMKRNVISGRSRDSSLHQLITSTYRNTTPITASLHKHYSVLFSSLLALEQFTILHPQLLLSPQSGLGFWHSRWNQTP